MIARLTRLDVLVGWLADPC